MYTEENSKLISSLYNCTSRQEISDTLEFMGESGDPIFVYPILDGYKKYKQSSVGYYFLWNLSRLDYSNLGQRLGELLCSYEILKDHIPLALFFMSERRYSCECANKMARMYMHSCSDPDFRKDFGVTVLEISCVLEYAYKAGILAEFEGRLREIIFAATADDGDKVMALSFLLEADRGKQLDYLVENYHSKIKNTFLEKRLAWKLIYCHTSNAGKLKKLILENGQEEAADILSQYEHLMKKKGNEEEITVYNNVDTVVKIGIIREQINKKAFSSEQIGFSIFPVSGFISDQCQCLDDKGVFMSLCLNLHEIVRMVDPRAREHGFSAEESGALLGNTPENKKNLNLACLFLFLNTKGVGVDNDFFGLRGLDRTLDLLLEDKGDKEFFDKLDSLGIASMYRQKKWHKIHAYLLNAYLQSMDVMNKAMNQFAIQDLGDQS